MLWYFLGTVALALVAGEISVFVARRRGKPYYNFNRAWLRKYFQAASFTFAGNIFTADSVLKPVEHAHEWYHWEEEQRLGFSAHKARWVYWAVKNFLKYGTSKTEITVTDGSKVFTIRKYLWYSMIPEEQAADLFERTDIDRFEERRV